MHRCLIITFIVHLYLSIYFLCCCFLRVCFSFCIQSYEIWIICKQIYFTCSIRNFGLARNLIRRIILPSQDDLSYSPWTSFLGSRNQVSCQTHSLWLNNTVQCRRLTGGSSIAAAAWTHEGTYLIYGFLASIT